MKDNTQIQISQVLFLFLEGITSVVVITVVMKYNAFDGHVFENSLLIHFELLNPSWSTPMHSKLVLFGTYSRVHMIKNIFFIVLSKG